VLDVTLPSQAHISSDWTMREHVAQIVEIKDQIPTCPNAHEAPAAVKLPDDELMNVLELRCPNSWQKQMILQDFDSVTSTTAEFVQFCEQI
jgi:hypothetical protein